MMLRALVVLAVAAVATCTPAPADEPVLCRGTPCAVGEVCIDNVCRTPCTGDTDDCADGEACCDGACTADFAACASCGLAINNCDDGSSCNAADIDSLNAGDGICIAQAGDGIADYADCSIAGVTGNNVCERGSQCLASMCQSFCDGDGSCAQRESCRRVGTDVFTCRPDCDPEDPRSCDAHGLAATCSVVDFGTCDAFCIQAGDGQLGEPCSGNERQCLAGFLCVLGACRATCQTDAPACVLGTDCVAFGACSTAGVCVP